MKIGCRLTDYHHCWHSALPIQLRHLRCQMIGSLPGTDYLLGRLRRWHFLMVAGDWLRN